MRAVGSEAAEAAQAEVVVLAEVVLFQTLGRLLPLCVEVTLLGLYLARLLVARVQLVRIVAREDEVLDLEFLLIQHVLKILDLLLVLNFF